MGIFTDLHLLVCIIAFIYLFQKARDSTQSRVLGVAIAGFIVFFIFFQHVWIAFLFFFIMFGYLFLGGFTAGLVEGSLASTYSYYLKNPQSGMPLYPGITPMGPPSGTIGSGWITPGAKSEKK